MTPVVLIGNGCIGLAVGFSLFGIISFFVGHRIRSGTATALGRASAYACFILMTVAGLAMVYALLDDDFSVSYVAHVGSRETPRRISAISLWSSLEGSILLWAWILSAFSAVCLYRYREGKERFMAWVGLTLSVVQFFFYLLIALPANPFLPVFPVPENGPGPNPLLQNHWLMAIHPPCLYIGYIGFTIPFAFAIAALIESRSPPYPLPQGEGDGERRSWLTVAKPWILFAWSFLSMAIVLGGWWSYAVLGWGGYWAWDPVENASFMPWLTATALVHSTLVQERRKILPVWNLILTVLTFLLTLLGTFLTRSGVLDSVHSFTESHIGPFFLVFIGIVLIASVALLLWRGPAFRQPGKIESLLSLEVMFLVNNLLFVSFCFVVFLGTLYPLIVEAIHGARISVGQPYFNQMSVPLVGMILLLMTVGWITPWRKGTFFDWIATVRLPTVLSLIPVLISIFLGGRTPWVVAVIYLASLAFLVMVIEWMRKGSRRRTGGLIAHTGALMIIVAVVLSGTYSRDEELSLKKGESAVVGDYRLTLNGIGSREVPQRFEVRADLAVERGNRNLGTLVPQMNYYPNSREPIGSPAIRSTLLGDLYLTLIHFEKDGSSASFRVITRPAVAWIWIGGAVVMLGGLTTLSFGKKEREG